MLAAGFALGFVAFTSVHPAFAQSQPAQDDEDADYFGDTCAQCPAMQ